MANTVSQSATPIHVNVQGTTPSVNGRVASNSSVPVHREHGSVSSNNQYATPMQVDDQGRHIVSEGYLLRRYL
ncbi:unnamed protein product [Lactuca virosa]|uniref:Uncharacterized protein n=1 Tax=Lactuca virosa TaxID=75947 RepID=A0AAU9P7Y4_9ASTR|nr:unnamed protein product [Lactuca virosa]